MMTMLSEHYGPLEEQLGDLYLPAVARPPIVCLLHGGFWRMPYGREQMTAVAADLAERGFAVWNLEYRRLGARGGGWPGTFDDVVAGVAHLEKVAARGVGLDLRRLTVAGHSAGGQLALWAGGRGVDESPPSTGKRVRIAAVAALAPIADLERAHDLQVGGTAIAELLAGTPQSARTTYRMASPRQLLPLGIPQLLLHGTADDVVPIDISREYARAARLAGDDVELRELDGLGHMEYLDPSSAAHDALCRWLERMTAE